MTDKIVAGEKSTVGNGDGVNGDRSDGRAVERLDGPAGGSGCVSDYESNAQLPPRQMMLLMALIENPNMTLAAKTVGISRMTAYRWLKNPAFNDELARHRQDVFEETLAAVKAHATKAVTQLSELMEAKKSSVRRKACTDIIDRALKVHNLQDIGERLTVLEKEAEKSKRLRRQG